ncbi:PLP-dependent transferase [Aspergillus taichungensis]|uniref:PLP-dependent transferase n=1 Tax=Aspergillus taichungensis TaxID=482145 RepID=A0A2J5HU04_9EURO|nr:PLP-dependent transferase [Aspergillus taichungensis]
MSRWKRRTKSRADKDLKPPGALAGGSPSDTRSTALASLHAVSTSPERSRIEVPSDPVEARRLAKRYAEFGPLGDAAHLYTSEHPGGEIPDPIIDDPPYFFVLTTYLNFLVLIFFGHFHDFFAKWFCADTYRHLRPQNGYASLYSDFESFYTRRLKQRIDDCFERPTTGVPGRYITLLDRVSKDNVLFQLTGTTTDTLNLSSYNYLGFAQSEGPCADNAEATIRRDGISMGGSCSDAGSSKLQGDVEDQIARFVGKEAAVVFSMGFVTNATIFPAIVDKGCLILSDELNHASIRFGSRLSGAAIQVFAHNNMEDLEQRLREAIAQGQPRSHRPWRKILLTVEGLFSMEGTMCNLPRILALKKRYKFHLFVDEAHSIGAVGPRGRGVCDYFQVDPAGVDILMGTFTKSFGANGGYIAADRAVIDQLRCINAGMVFGEAPSPPILGQISSALRLIADADPRHPGQGRERVQRLAFNSRYLRLGLKRLGFIVYGHDDSPIVPLMLYNPGKMPAFSHEMLRRKISVVVVTYPATPLELSRARLCVSAAHTKDDLDRVLRACDEIGTALNLKFSSGVAGGLRVPPPADYLRVTKGRKATTVPLPIEPPRWTVDDVILHTTRDAKLALY